MHSIRTLNFAENKNQGGLKNNFDRRNPHIHTADNNTTHPREKKSGQSKKKSMTMSPILIAALAVLHSVWSMRNPTFALIQR